MYSLDKNYNVYFALLPDRCFSATFRLVKLVQMIYSFNSCQYVFFFMREREREREREVPDRKLNFFAISNEIYFW